MARVEHTYLHGRDDFFRLLAELRAEAERYVQAVPVDLTLAAIHRQLAAIERWTAAGRAPTREERRSVDMGTRVARELEHPDSDDLADFAAKVSELDFYFKHWLDDAAWNALDDEDLATYFPLD